MNECMDGCKEGEVDERIGGWMDEAIEGWRMNVWARGQMDGWLGGWTDGWPEGSNKVRVDRWVEGRMNE
jgi:hypothetical protein